MLLPWLWSQWWCFHTVHRPALSFFNGLCCSEHLTNPEIADERRNKGSIHSMLQATKEKESEMACWMFQAFNRLAGFMSWVLAADLRGLARLYFWGLRKMLRLPLSQKILKKLITSHDNLTPSLVMGFIFHTETSVFFTPSPSLEHM